MKERSLLLNEKREETLAEVKSDYPYGMKRLDFTLFSIPWHWHEEVEFVYIEEGSEKVITNNDTYTIREGEAYFLNTNVLDCKRKSDDVPIMKETAHLFHPVLLSGYFRSVYQTRYLDPILKNSDLEIVIFRNDTDNGKDFIQKIKKLTALQAREHVEFETRNLLSEMWQLLLKEVQNNVPERTHSFQSQNRIRYMLSYISQHYDEKITLKDLAESALISEREAIRCFKKNVGKAPFDYLTEYRVGKSRELLSDTDLAITEIAMNTGFTSSSYYGKVFRRYFGMSPMQYRKQYKKLNPSAER
jgi:AraC-like DNA-binding protein